MWRSSGHEDGTGDDRYLRTAAAAGLAALLQTHVVQRGSGPALDVTDRTVRRDIDRLRELGYGVESVPGPGGGYRFGAGNRMPPLSLDDDEVFAVAMALREAAQGAALGADPAALSALLKLRQILPVRMARRLESLDATVEHTPRCESPRASADVLLLLASVCRASERATLTYRDTHGITTVRCVDPHRLVHTGVHWYFVARDVERSAWRTFRADRVVDVESTGEVVDLSDAPDAAQLVSDTITRTGHPFFARVRLPCPSTTPAGWWHPSSPPTSPKDRTGRSSPSGDPTPTSSPATCSACARPWRSCPPTASAKHCSPASTPCTARMTRLRRKPSGRHDVRRVSVTGSDRAARLLSCAHATQGPLQTGVDALHGGRVGLRHVDVEAVGEDEDPPQAFGQLVPQLGVHITVDAPGAFGGQTRRPT